MRLCTVCNKIVAPQDCGRADCPMAVQEGGPQTLNLNAAAKQPVKSLLSREPETPPARVDITPQVAETSVGITAAEAEVPAAPIGQAAAQTVAVPTSVPRAAYAGEEQKPQSARPVIFGLAGIVLVILAGWASWQYLWQAKTLEYKDPAAYQTEESIEPTAGAEAFEPPVEVPVSTVPTVSGPFEATAADQVITLSFAGSEPVPAHLADGTIDYLNSVTGASCSASIVRRADSLSAPNSPVTYDQVPIPGVSACPSAYRLELQPEKGGVNDYGQVTSLSARWLDGNTGRTILTTTLASMGDNVD